VPLSNQGLSTSREHALLGLLVRVAAASNLATSLQAAAQIAIDAICEVTGWEIGHFYMLDPDDPDRLLPTTIWRIADPDLYREFQRITEEMPMPRGIGLPGRVLATAEPLWIEDVTKDSNFPRAKKATDVGVKAAFGVPVLSGPGVLGVLEFFNRRAMEPDAPLLYVLAQVGIQLGRVGERGRAEQALRDSEERFRAIAQSAVDAIVSADHRGMITYWNAAAERMFGYSPEEIVGRPLWTLMPERFREAHTRGIERATRGGPPAVIGRTVELAGITKNGDEFPLELSLSTWRAGSDMFFTGIIRDITERKRVEHALQEKEESLRQVAKMESIGRLAGGVAHDFNNLLTVIMGYVELLKLTQLPAPAGRMINHISKASQQAAALTQRLLAFSRKQLLQPDVVDSAALIDDIEDMIRRLVGEDVEIIVETSAETWPVKVDPNQFEQVLLNLAVNARDAMPDGGRLTFKVENRRVERAEPLGPSHLPPGEYTIISVADTGFGMDKETQARAFEPFFTTKPPEKGTGLGLAMAYGFIKQSGGFIGIDSEVGRGTKVTIYLPRVTGEPSARVKHGEVVPAPGRETVLVVEDEAGVRALLTESLRRTGYAVLAAARPEAAMKISAEHPRQIDLIVTDVVMPELSGPKLVEWLMPHQPQMRVLYISGYADDEVVQRGLQQGSIEFLQKPFTLPNLLAKVRHVLDMQ
jgi:two-component system cell cycle sensor histidine kinase/response regulator CckA